MHIETESPRDGSTPVSLHVHNHVPMPPPAPPRIVSVPDDDRPRRRRRRPEPRGRFGAFWAKALRIAWEAGGLLLLGFLNVMVLSQGLIELSPNLFGARLSTMPGFGGLAGYLVWNRVLVGHLIALGFFCVMAFAWKVVVRDLLLARGNELIDESEWNVARARVFWRVCCGVLMATDALLFYYGVTQSNLWLKQTHYFSALVSTLMYLAIVAVYSFGCLYFADWERSE